MNSLKKGEEVLLLNFEEGPGVPLLNLNGGFGSHFLIIGEFAGLLLNFERRPDPGSQVLEVSGTVVLASLLHHDHSYRRISFPIIESIPKLPLSHNSSTQHFCALCVISHVFTIQSRFYFFLIFHAH